MKRRSAIIAIISVTCLLGLLSFSNPGEAGERTVGKIDPAALKNQVIGQEATLSLDSLTASKTFRDLPSISGNYTVKGKRIMPYIGAGFGHGYTSDVDRSLNGSPSSQTDPGLRSLFGQGLTPSEFQMGLRIPF
ncbi:MAG TPA: hypothetical protein VFR82_11325 [Nitrospira sp.]|nr:hypothetical protein [Nitrospira sp.]